MSDSCEAPPLKALVLNDVLRTGKIYLANKYYRGAECISVSSDPEYSRVLFVIGKKDVCREDRATFVRILETISNEDWYLDNIQRYGIELTEDEYEQAKPLLEAVGWEIEEEDFYGERDGA